MKKKNLIVLLLIAVIGIVGVTIAYFSSTTTFENEFNTKEYGTTYTESFVSPDNWLPGDTTNKTVIVTNSGTVDEAVRISLSETWIPNNSNATLNGWIHADGTKSNHTTENELSTDVRAAIINFTDNSDWTKVGDYYYYNYRLAPGQTTDSLIESVTFNALTKLGDTCTPSTNNGTTTIICNSSGEDYDHATYKLTVNIETVQYNKYTSAWNTNFAIASEKPLSGVDTLLTNAVNTSGTEYNDMTKSKMFVMTHPRTDQTPAQTEYRYIGDNPNNYVYFNCDSLDNQNSETCEVWRIIGVFDVDDGTGNYEQRIKLVRGSALPDRMKWDTNNVNDWSVASLKAYLNDNGEYYTRTGTAANYGLKATAKSLISDAKYYLGGTFNNDIYNNSENSYGTADAMYLWERGSEVFSYETYCLSLSVNHSNNSKCTTENYCENNPTDKICSSIRNISWVGKIALIYPSDYALVYANGVDSGCYGHPAYCYLTDTHFNSNPSAGWIFNSYKLDGQNSNDWSWLLSPYSDSLTHVFHINGAGSIYTSGMEAAGYSMGNRGEAVRPVLYLSSNVKITDGTGEQNNPYKLGL